MKLRQHVMYFAAAAMLAVALPASAQLLGGAVGGTLNGALGGAAGGGGLHGGLTGSGGLHGDLRGTTDTLRGAKGKARETSAAAVDRTRDAADKAHGKVQETLDNARAAGGADGNAAVSRDGVVLGGNVSGDAGVSKPVEASQASAE